MKILRALLKLMLSLIGVTVLAVLGFGGMFLVGENDVRNFCHDAKSGLPVEQLASLAKKHGVQFRLPGLREESGKYFFFAHTWRSYGRHTCMVQHDTVSVISARYGYAD